mmetsp:Transcript_12071/g.1825  ORF Transcript_12071/g.1825 Transcript_12071/m.1825 type:complete len:89 (-) Transcript_12071:125-391(-)
MTYLNITKTVLMGRSVGARTSVEFSHKYPEKVSLIILGGPVFPHDNIVASVKQPILLAWAKDDGEWANYTGHANAGHPYYGPNGAAHI